MKSILFICTHNSARSQIAEGLVNAYHPGYKAFSAGTERTRVNPFAIQVMKNIGIDISLHYSKTIEEFRFEFFDLVVTVCDDARETCPFYPNAGQIIHQAFLDPSESKGDYVELLKSFETTRDEIHDWLKSFL